MMKRYPYLLTIGKDPFYKQISVSGFFKAIGKGTLAALASSEPTTGALVGGKEAISMLNHKVSVSHRAFELLLNGIEQACTALIEKHQVELTENDTLLLPKRVEGTIEVIDISITPIFFDKPQQLPAFQDLIPVFQYWLEGTGETRSKAIAISKELPAVFFKTIILEWWRRKEYYQVIEDYFKHPFIKAWEEQYHRTVYYEELKRLFHQPALGDELLPLSTIYQEPNFLMYEECLEQKRSKDYNYDKDGFIKTEKWYNSLHDYLNVWLNDESSPLAVKGKQLLILLGQPGQGKSSFCYKTLSLLLENPSPNKKVYFIRLRDLSTKDQLIKQPFNIFERHLKKRTKLSTINFENSLLLLDGLDELYMSDGLTNQDLKRFYERLEHRVEEEENFHLILTSRYNYLNIEGIEEDVATIVKLAPLSFPKQEAWLSIYKEAHPTCLLTIDSLKEINDQKRLEHIKELIEQPILLHLIARAEVEINVNLDRAKIYEDLFDTIIRRSWEKQQLKKYKNLTKEAHSNLFRTWLQEIAFTIHQSEEGYIHHHEITDLDSSQKLKDILATSEEMGDALKDLLVAFYFRNVVGGNMEEAHPIEFLHQSLREYLAVEYIWKRIQSITSSQDPLDNLSLLKEITNLFGQKPLNDNMRGMLLEMIQHTSIATRMLVRARLKKVLPFCLKHQFLYGYEAGEGGVAPLKQMENNFKSFWFLLAHLAEDKKTNEALLLENDKDSFSRLLVVFGGIGMKLSDADLR
ncbi:MAG: NACHT domain-containing protein, partial [Aureispira sp.]